METLYIVIGAVSSIVIFLLGYSVNGVLNGKKRLDYLESYLEDTERLIQTLDRDVNHRVDVEIESTHQAFRDVEVDLRGQLDSRIDKLTNQIMKKIPPTNDELMKRIEKIEEESYRLRMNM
tara:strand:- start:66 stop:428 length:363 start_codon:yes stop_codon:yes gene_type:complete